MNRRDVKENARFHDPHNNQDGKLVTRTIMNRSLWMMLFDSGEIKELAEADLRRIKKASRDKKAFHDVLARELVGIAKELMGEKVKFPKLSRSSGRTKIGMVTSRGKAQDAVLKYLDEIGGAVTLTDLVRMSGFRGIHYGQVEQSVNILKKKGLVKFDGKTLSKA